MDFNEKNKKLLLVRSIDFICFLALLAYCVPLFYNVQFNIKYWPIPFIIAVMAFFEGYVAILKGELEARYETYSKRDNFTYFRIGVLLSFFASLMCLIFGILLIIKNI